MTESASQTERTLQTGRASLGGVAQLSTQMGRVAKDSSGLRYLFTGGGLFFLDLGIYVLLHVGFGVGIMKAQFISRTVGAAVGFIAHKFISFGAFGGQDEKQSVSVASQGVAYTLVMGTNIVISPFLVALMVMLVGGHAILGKLLSDAIIIAETYLLLRIIFRSHPEPSARIS
jgi:putative flippase GtrA